MVSIFKLEHVWISCISNLTESEVILMILQEIKRLRKTEERIKYKKKKYYFDFLFKRISIKLFIIQFDFL